MCVCLCVCCYLEHWGCVCVVNNLCATVLFRIITLNVFRGVFLNTSQIGRSHNNES